MGHFKSGREQSLSKVQFFVLFICICCAVGVCACLGYAAVSGPSYLVMRSGWRQNAVDNVGFFGSQQQKPQNVSSDSTQQTEAPVLDGSVTTPNSSLPAVDNTQTNAVNMTQQIPVPVIDTAKANAVINQVEASLKKSGKTGNSAHFQAVAKRVCDILYCESKAPRVITPAHHKTGWSLTHCLTRTMDEYCPCYYRFLHMSFAGGTQGNGPIARKYQNFVKDDVFSNGYTLVHFNREPVGTIVSAYFYHQVSPEQIGTKTIKGLHFNSERVTMQFEDDSEKALESRRRRLLLASGNRTDASKRLAYGNKNDTSARRRLAFVQNGGGNGGQRDTRYNKVWNEVIDASPLWKYGLIDNSTRVHIRTHHSLSQCVFTPLPTTLPFLKEVPKSDAYFVEIGRVIEKLKEPETKTLQKVYKNWPVKDGLMAELLRYFHCEMPNGMLQHLTAPHFSEAFSAMAAWTNLNRTAKTGTVVTFDLDTTSFAEMANGMVDAFNIQHSNENELRLKSLADEFGVSSAALTAATRFSMTEHLAETCDLKRRASKDGHSTHNKHPPAPFRQQLVEISPGICQLLKRLTLAMDLMWQYPDVC